MMGIQNSLAAGQRRASWLDYDKGITILFVAFGHCVDKLFVNPSTGIEEHSYLLYLALFMYGFRMPLFFMVSGILLNSNLQKKGLPKYLGTRVDLLYAMLIWGIIQVSLKLLAHKSSITYWSYLDLLTAPRNIGHLWYLNAFFCICVLYSFTKVKLNLSAIHQLFIGLILYCVASFILVNEVNAGFLTDVFKYYFFFALGNVICDWIRDKKVQQAFCSQKFFVTLLVSFLCLQYYCTSLNLQHNQYDHFYVENNLPFLYLLQGLLGCAFSISLSFLLEKHNRLLWITRIGRYSLYIYLSHLLFISLTYSVLKPFENVLYTPVILFILWTSAILSPIVLYNLCIRFNFRWLFSLHKLKRLEKRNRPSAIEGENISLSPSYSLTAR